MFSSCSELTPRAPIPDGKMEQFMQPCLVEGKENALYFNLIGVKRFCLFELYCREKR